ncbi:MAG: ASCH domain-containing protein [Aureispira sp.]|nr:ASCH domain-containing protein [Aureispira sp.]
MDTRAMIKTLHLTLTKKWFDLILSGKKTIEYRECKPYWKARLEGKSFDEIVFINGYGKDRPFMRVEFATMFKARVHYDTTGANGKIFNANVNCYAIVLGEILETRNIDD